MEGGARAGRDEVTSDGANAMSPTFIVNNHHNCM